MDLTCENYRSIFDLACDAIFVFDGNSGAVIDVSDKAVDLYGYSPEQMKQAGFEALSAGWFPYNQEGVMEHIRQAAGSGQKSFEWFAKDRSDRTFWVEVDLKQSVIIGSGSARRLRLPGQECRGNPGNDVFFQPRHSAPDSELPDMFEAVATQIGDFIKRKKAEEHLRMALLSTARTTGKRACA